MSEVSGFLFSIGVVIPTFIESPEALARLNVTLDSILSQEFAPKQIVVSDDSPSKFSNVVQELCISKRGITVEYIKHLGAPGVSANSNHGISYLNTEFIHCLHQDDYLKNSNCYSSVKTILGNQSNSWVLLGGVASSTRIIPALINGRLPLEMNLGINTIGGPSAVIFPSLPEVRFSENFSMLCDVKLFLDLQDILGPPAVLDSVEIVYQMGEWQLQKRISDSEVISELLILNSQRREELRSSLNLVLNQKNRLDVKLRGLIVMSKVSKKLRWKVLVILFRCYVILRFRIRIILKGNG